MRTFFAFLHIGKVEWVTDQVPSSHSSGGVEKAVEVGSWGLYFLGDRKVISGYIAVPEMRGGALTTFLSPNIDLPSSGAREIGGSAMLTACSGIARLLIVKGCSLVTN